MCCKLHTICASMFLPWGGKERKEGGVPLFAVGNVEWMAVYMCSVVECFVLIVFGSISYQLCN